MTSLAGRLEQHVLIWMVFVVARLLAKDWTNSGYPDIRGPTYGKCDVNISTSHILYLCDPDRILADQESIKINAMMEKLAVDTPCPCQRRSQCSSGSNRISSFHGFIVSIALVNNLQMNFHSPSEQQLTDRAGSFCKTLEGRWALGDCGNSVLIFVWQHYKKLIIWPARLAERYVTQEERKRIVSSVNDLIQADQWAEALETVITEIENELKGEPEERVDTGTLSLIIAVGVASLLTGLITCCVCAFRCCGNLSPEDDTKSLSRNDSSFTSSLNQKPFAPPPSLPPMNNHYRADSRSPKFPLRGATFSLEPQPLNYVLESDTTIV